MSAKPAGVPTLDHERDSGPKNFRLDVDIKGLPYVFEGSAPERPDGFKWTVSVPNWEELRSNVDEMAARNDWFPALLGDLRSRGLGDGRVGSLFVDKHDAPDGAPSVAGKYIDSEPNYLVGTEYEHAEGIGSFLLDNLCALADARGWRIYIFPYAKGKLMQPDLLAWYGRRGFVDQSSLPAELRHIGDNTYPMLRQPQPHGSVQAISQAI